MGRDCMLCLYSLSVLFLKNDVLMRNAELVNKKSERKDDQQAFIQVQEEEVKKNSDEN